MSTELVLLPRSQYATLLGKKCDSSENATETQKPVMEQSTVVPSSPVGNNLPHTTHEPAKSTATTTTNINGDEQARAGLGERLDKLNETSSDNIYDGATSKNVKTVTEEDESATIEKTGEMSLIKNSVAESTPSDSKMDYTSLVSKFKENDQKYIKNIIDACMKNSEIISWNSEGIVKIKDDEIEGSNIFQLLSDTLTDKKNPVGKLAFYMALSDVGVTSKDLKNRNNKAFFNAVNGKKVVKKKSSANNNKRKLGEISINHGNDVDNDKNGTLVKLEHSPPKKKNAWLSW